MKKLGKYFWLLVIALLIVPCYTLSAQAAQKKQNKKKFVVVIDAGHGGNDVGAMDNGIKEKDINLAVAKKVGELLKEKMKNEVEVIYTREKDTFLTLQQRADVANNKHADLFISIHTNSVDQNNPNRTTVSGASVYTLGTEKDERNLSVVRKENALVSSDGKTVKYQDFDPDSDEAFIAYEMYQKNNMANSIALANAIQKELVNTAKRKDRGVHQAGFWVLWATSMPSALVELDFICNPEEAKYLSSRKGQDKLAQSIFQGIKSYYNDYKKQAAQKKSQKEEQEVNPANFNSQATVTSAESERRVSQAPTLQSQYSANNNAPRKRRNNNARRISSQRDIDVAVIEGPEAPAEVVAETTNDYAYNAHTAANTVQQSVPAQEQKVTERHAEHAAVGTSRAQQSVDKSNQTADARVQDRINTSRKQQADQQQAQQRQQQQQAQETASARQQAQMQADAKKQAAQNKKPAEKPAAKQPEKTVNQRQQPTAQATTANRPQTRNNRTGATVSTASTQQNVAKTTNNNTTTQATASANTKTKGSQRQTTGGKPARLNTYYSVQLLESTEEIDVNDPRFKGVSGKVTRHTTTNGKYSYTVGKYTENADTVPDVNKYKGRFPQAKSVRINSGTGNVIQ